MHGAMLELLSQQSGFFISELKNPRHFPYVLRTCLSLHLEQYDLEEINYTFSYLFDAELSFCSLKEAKDYLRRQSDKKACPAAP